MTEEERRDQLVRYWLDKAGEALAAARLCWTHGLLTSSVNRAYYAASAWLLREGRRFRKHTGVQAGVHQHLVQGGHLETSWGEMYDRLYNSRMRSDYQDWVQIEPDAAAERLRNAEDLVGRLERLIG
ncbi:MAG: HEPN domain-containing protein [Armatimonadetes bacterium]|nr:HEPN domain-containing protein [Armatimonadota bacterium]